MYYNRIREVYTKVNSISRPPVIEYRDLVTSRVEKWI